MADGESAQDKLGGSDRGSRESASVWPGRKQDAPN